jgi:hypothetical protein
MEMRAGAPRHQLRSGIVTFARVALGGAGARSTILTVGEAAANQKHFCCPVSTMTMAFCKDEVKLQLLSIPKLIECM